MRQTRMVSSVIGSSPVPYRLTVGLLPTRRFAQILERCPRGMPWWDQNSPFSKTRARTTFLAFSNNLNAVRSDMEIRSALRRSCLASADMRRQKACLRDSPRAPLALTREHQQPVEVDMGRKMRREPIQGHLDARLIVDQGGTGAQARQQGGALAVVGK